MKIRTPSDQLPINRRAQDGLYEISIRLHRSVCSGRRAEIERHRWQWRKIGNLPKQFARRSHLIDVLLLLASPYYFQVGHPCDPLKFSALRHVSVTMTL